jgi:outer membrane protein
VRKFQCFRVTRFAIFNFCLLFAGGAYAQSKNYVQQLQSFYHDALVNDADFLQAKVALRSAEQDLPLATSAFLPQLSSNSLVKSNYEKGSTPGFAININQPVFDWHAMQKIGQARQLVKAAQEKFSLAGQDLMRRVVSAYLDVYAAQQKLALTAKRVKSLHQQLVAAEKRFSNGHLTQVDVAQVRGSYNLYAAEAMNAKLDLAHQIQALGLIVGVQNLKSIATISINYCGTRSSQDCVGHSAMTTFRSWQHDITERNLLLKLERQYIQVARLAVSAEQANYLPTVSLSGSYYPDRYYQQPQNKHFMYGLNVSFANLNAGQTRAKVQQARYALEQAVRSNQAAYQRVLTDAHNAFQAMSISHEQIDVQQKAVNAGDQALGGVIKQMELGEATVSNLIEVNDKLYQANTALLSGEMQYLRSVLALKFDAGLLTDPASLTKIFQSS